MSLLAYIVNQHTSATTPEFQQAYRENAQSLFLRHGAGGLPAGHPVGGGLTVHFARGSLFENLIINKLTKNWLNRGQRPPFYFWSDQFSHEVDLLIDRGTGLTAVEIKSSKTIHPSFFTRLQYFDKLVPQTALTLLYGGDSPQRRTGVSVLTLNELDELN